MPENLTNSQLAQMAQQYLMPNYGPREIALARGEGARCWDADGKQYLDFLSGIAVNNLGHCHPHVVAAIREQAANLLHCSNFFLTEQQTLLGKRLAEQTGLAKVFFANTGTEATEAALKLARRRAHETKGPDHDTIIVFENSFHGRTWGAMSATASKKVREGFGPLVPGFKFARLNDIDSVKELWDDTVCAVMVETIQGEGGIRPCDRDFVRELRVLCDERDALLIMDEIQCGMGRSGRVFAYQHADIKPDLVPIAKGLGGGMPIGALIASEKAADVFQPGSHGTTFGGNPVACAAALAVCDIIFDDDFLQEVGRKGCKWWGSLEEIKKAHPDRISEIRGMGLMIGMEFNEPCKDILPIARRHGLIFNCTAEKVLRFLPPLTVADEELDEGAELLRAAINECLGA